MVLDYHLLHFAPCRKVTKITNDTCTVEGKTPILIIDSGADQTLITHHWTVTRKTGRFVYLTGPLAGQSQGSRFEVVSAAAIIVDETGNKYYATVHEALYDPSLEQTESLLSKHQSLRLSSNGIDDCS